MKQTEKWLPIAQKKAQLELTFLRQQIKALESFQSINHLPEITQQRRLISSDIKLTRRLLREERYKAVLLRGDLPAEMYRPSPPKKPDVADIIPFDLQTTESQQRQLLLVS